ncbi:efflux RND transporter periplasmic adaptor subunit [Paraurantiacibacter namhicola]|uniref:Nickel and cobalt resistance protein CnrB n=1 Tax=Paraurantiacibacter namhicola TaxID=645517 RepID=A0A1C7DB36_9SPHN|nr:efflux RND transporter periplasmic adaptor subunit [Paraurantiacibacter namhicola]ANU08699.1 Nickel and cobalt resistance protein CnrB [Paraurantiacibacter namhicola]
MKAAHKIACGIAAAALMIGTWAAWPDHPQAHDEDDHAEGTEAEVEGVLTLSPEQIRNAGISLETVGRGAAVELLFPATVVASPTGVGVIDARAPGIVRSISKTLGDSVRRGEVVARIESAEAADLAATLSAARAEAVELQAAYERERRLFEEGVTARQDLETARAHLMVAQAEVRRAEAAYAAAGVSGDGRSLAVTSPLSGRITASDATLGAYVNAGDELYRVVDPAALQVEVALPFVDASRISPGDEAALLLPDGREIGARVRSVTPSLDPESRSATAVLGLVRSIPGLQPGSFLQARLRPSGEIDTNRMAIPEDAVQVVEGREVVFVRTRTGFRTQPVETGNRSGGRVTILSGLEPGKIIATTNAFLLKAELGKEGATHGH